jgi:hypothetical protein
MAIEGTLGVIYILIITIIAILWIMLPFAVFGIKRKLDVMIEIMKEMRTAMTEMRSELNRAK